MATPEKIVVIGAGLAGAKTAERLRTLGYGGSLTLIGNESEAPYERPPLSKEYLAGSSDFKDALVHPVDWYSKKDIDLRLSTTATAINTAMRTVTCDDGTELEYDVLVLATGATPRQTTLPGSDAAGVLYLRNREDSDAIRAATTEGQKFTIIGGGWIGLEVAATARNAGAEVTVLELDHLPLARIIGDQPAEVFAKLHRDHGVDLRTEAEAAEILTHDGSVSGVMLKDGTRIAADTVIVGIGAMPNISLAQDAGLSIEAGGIAVDSTLRTSDPAIYAVGDIAAHEHPLLESRTRLEHWAAALNQPKALAHTILGKETEYTELPYFFTDQYDLGMEYIGSVPHGVEPKVVIRGSLDSRKFVAFYLDTDGAILAAMAVNVWNVIDVIKPLILNKTKIDQHHLTDMSIPISEL